MPATTRSSTGNSRPKSPSGATKKSKPAAVGFQAGIEQEIVANWIDVPCSWTLLASIVGLCAVGESIIGTVCPNFGEGKFLTFSCPEAITFGWIFSTTSFLVATLPARTTNPWELAFCPGMPLRKRAVKFGLQVAAAASFAFAMKHFAKDFARQVYREAAPKVNLCHAPSAGEPHREFFKGQSAHCVHEWPSWENGALRIGAVLNEAAHTCFLNLMVAILCPYAGKYFYFVVAAMVVTTLRSPYCFTGPGLNMVPSMMGAALYGGLENLRVHLFGTFLGMLTAAQIERRTGIIKSGFAAALSWRPGATKEIVEADLSWAESRRKAPARGKAKSKEA